MEVHALPRVYRRSRGRRKTWPAARRGVPLAPLMSPTAPLKETLLKLCRREDLTRDEAREAFAHLLSGQATDAQIGGLLVGLATKGTTVEELVGAATVMREKSIPVPCEGDGVIIDTCG